MRGCEVAGCGGTFKARGMCGKHYMQVVRAGDLPARLSPAERLFARLVRVPSGCLEWTGSTDWDGYGHFWGDNKLVQTHRFAWELEHGPVPPGMHVLHHCDNPPCADAIDTEHHLFLGTHADNMADMGVKGRARSSKLLTGRYGPGSPAGKTPRVL